MDEEKLKKKKFWTYMVGVAAAVLFALSFVAGDIWGPEKIVPFRALGGVCLIIFVLGLPKTRPPKVKEEDQF